jgi:hypothetical protein
MCCGMLLVGISHRVLPQRGVSAVPAATSQKYRRTFARRTSTCRGPTRPRTPDADLQHCDLTASGACPPSHGLQGSPEGGTPRPPPEDRPSVAHAVCSHTCLMRVCCTVICCACQRRVPALTRVKRIAGGSYPTSPAEDRPSVAQAICSHTCLMRICCTVICLPAALARPHTSQKDRRELPLHELAEDPPEHRTRGLRTHMLAFYLLHCDLFASGACPPSHESEGSPEARGVHRAQAVFAHTCLLSTCYTVICLPAALARPHKSRKDRRKLYLLH